MLPSLFFQFILVLVQLVVAAPQRALDNGPGASSWQVLPTNTTVNAIPDMKAPFAARILISEGNSVVSKFVDSQTSHNMSIARCGAFENSPVPPIGQPATTFGDVYLMPSSASSNSSNVEAKPGMIGLAAVKTYTSDADLFMSVRRALGFAISKRFSALLLFSDNSSSNKFDGDPVLIPDPLGSDMFPQPLASSGQSCLSPYAGSATGFNPPYDPIEWLYPLLRGSDKDGLRLFKMAFSGIDVSLMTIVLEGATGRSLREKILNRQQKPESGSIKLAVESLFIRVNLVGPPKQQSSSLGIWLVMIIAIGAIIFVACAVWTQYNRYVRRRSALPKSEVTVVANALQTAIAMRRQHVSERRAQIQAAMPKPVKPNMDDIPTVVLDNTNIGPILERFTVIHPEAISSTTNERDISNDGNGGDVDDGNDDGVDSDNAGEQVSPLTQARALVRSDTNTVTHPLSDSVSRECCSICIEDFAIGDQVRVLPSCHHVFHVDCIDPWLGTTSALCPLCKSDTRSSTEIDEYNELLAAAKSNSLRSEQSRDINIEVAELFDQIIDEVSINQLGHVIKRAQPLTIKAVFSISGKTIVEFTTSVFVREDGNDNATAANKGWLSSSLKRLASRPNILKVTVRCGETNGNPPGRTSYPPAQQITTSI